MIEPLKVNFLRRDTDESTFLVKANGHSWNLRLMEQMRYEIKTFLLAGHETSASMLAWALYELLRNPKCLAKVTWRTYETY